MRPLVIVQVRPSGWTVALIQWPSQSSSSVRLAMSASSVLEIASVPYGFRSSVLCRARVGDPLIDHRERAWNTVHGRIEIVGQRYRRHGSSIRRGQRYAAGRSRNLNGSAQSTVSARRAGRRN